MILALGYTLTSLAWPLRPRVTFDRILEARVGRVIVECAVVVLDDNEHANRVRDMTLPVSASFEPRLAPTEKRRDAFLMILGKARQRELVDVHMAGEIVERVRQTIDGELGHGD